MPSNISEDTKDVAEGATKALLSWGEDKIKELLVKFKDRKLVFIRNKETIDLVKEQLKSGEWSLYKEHIHNTELRLLVQMGLALKRLENKPEALQNLRDKIVGKYLTRGLHIAEFVQNNILSSFIARLANKVSSASEISVELEEFLYHIDKYVLFVKKNMMLSKEYKK